MIPQPGGFQFERTERQLQRVLAALVDEPMTSLELSRALFTSLSSISTYKRLLLAEPKRIYVSGYASDGSMRPGAVYSVGNLPDVPFVRKRDAKVSIYDRQMYRAMGYLQEARSVAELSALLGLQSVGGATTYIRDLRSKKRVYISSWRHGKGPLTPLYRMGCGRDAKRPKKTRADDWKRDKADPERHERIKQKSRIATQLKAAVRKPQNIFSALGL